MLVRYLLLICAGLVILSGALVDTASAAGPLGEVIRVAVIVALLKPWLELHLQ